MGSTSNSHKTSSLSSSSKSRSTFPLTTAQSMKSNIKSAASRYLGIGGAEKKTSTKSLGQATKSGASKMTSKDLRGTSSVGRKIDKAKSLLKSPLARGLVLGGAGGAAAAAAVAMKHHKIDAQAKGKQSKIDAKTKNDKPGTEKPKKESKWQKFKDFFKKGIPNFFKKTVPHVFKKTIPHFFVDKVWNKGLKKYGQRIVGVMTKIASPLIKIGATIAGGVVDAFTGGVGGQVIMAAGNAAGSLLDVAGNSLMKNKGWKQAGKDMKTGIKEKFEKKVVGPDGKVTYKADAKTTIKTLLTDMTPGLGGVGSEASSVIKEGAHIAEAAATTGKLGKVVKEGVDVVKSTKVGKALETGIDAAKGKVAGETAQTKLGRLALKGAEKAKNIAKKGEQMVAKSNRTKQMIEKKKNEMLAGVETKAQKAKDWITHQTAPSTSTENGLKDEAATAKGKISQKIERFKQADEKYGLKDKAEDTYNDISNQNQQAQAATQQQQQQQQQQQPQPQDQQQQQQDQPSNVPAPTFDSSYTYTGD